MEKLRGSYPVLITPMTEEQEIDERGLKENIDWLISEGAPGLCILGGTGEFASLSKEERLYIAEMAVKYVNGRVKCIMGTASVSTRETVFYTQNAKDIGADAVLIINPYYGGNTEDEIYQHYKTISDSVDIPIMVYNNPHCSGADMKPELINRLFELKNVEYVKDASGDLRRIDDFKRLSNGKINIFCGCEDLAIENFMLGAIGWISVCGNFIPKKAQQLFELVSENKIEEARELFDKMFPLLDMLENSPKGIQMTKTALNLMGRPAGPCRFPKLPINDEEQKRLVKALKDLEVI